MSRVAVRQADQTDTQTQRCVTCSGQTGRPDRHTKTKTCHVQRSDKTDIQRQRHVTCSGLTTSQTYRGKDVSRAAARQPDQTDIQRQRRVTCSGQTQRERRVPCSGEGDERVASCFLAPARADITAVAVEVRVWILPYGPPPRNSAWARGARGQPGFYLRPQDTNLPFSHRSCFFASLVV